MSIQMIQEQDYVRQMEGVALPAIRAICTGGTFQRVPGEEIYYELYQPEQVRGWVAISHGFTESIHKYAELIYYFTQSGYAVAMPEHRGHGRSYRAVPEKWLTHVEAFSDYAEDFACFLRRVVLPLTEGKPLYMLGHSMGGAAAALTLMRHPKLPVEKLVLSSPMIAPETAGIPEPITRAMARFFILTGRAKERLFNQQPFSGADEFDEEWCCASGRPRYDWYRMEQCKCEDFQNSAATYRWLEEALLVTHTLLKQSNCDKLQLPVLLLQAGRDKTVKNSAQNQFVGQLPNCRMVQLPTAKHESFRSDDAVVEEFVETILRFIGD